MHVIVTGATGLVGTACLHQLATIASTTSSASTAQKRITKISVLSRRAVPLAEKYPDLIDVIIHKDFESYPPEVLEKLTGAEGCIWALTPPLRGIEKR